MAKSEPFKLLGLPILIRVRTLKQVSKKKDEFSIFKMALLAIHNVPVLAAFLVGSMSFAHNQILFLIGNLLSCIA